MRRRRLYRQRGMTLVEVLLALGLLAVLAALVAPTFFNEYQARKFPESARRMRSLVGLVRANASFDGLRYRIRFANREEEEKDGLGTWRQPIVEREDEPFDEPEVFNAVKASWAIGETLLGDTWCAEVRLGRPTVELIRDARENRSGIEDLIEERFEDYEPQRPPLEIDPDGTHEWVTFVLTEADDQLDLDALDDEVRIEVIIDGDTGLGWLQRPFYDEELDLFEDENWPVVLRMDFLDPRVLTEDDVLELREGAINTGG